jgi:hypothetical protein
MSDGCDLSLIGFPRKRSLDSIEFRTRDRSIERGTGQSNRVRTFEPGTGQFLATFIWNEGNKARSKAKEGTGP